MMKTERKSVWVIGAVGLLVALSLWAVSQLRFNYDFEAFFPQNDPATDFYLAHRDKFESDLDYFIVVLENNNGVFDSSFLAKVDALNDSLKKIEYIKDCVGPTQLMDVVKDPVFGGFFQSPWLDFRNPEGYGIDSAHIYGIGQWVGIFFSPDGKSVAINMKHEQGLAVKKCDVLYDNIQNTVGQFQFDGVHLIGRAKGQKLLVELMIKELVMFVGLCLICTVIFLYIAFRSFWGIVIPAAVVFLSILFTMAFMQILGKDIDVMVTIMPTILFVVGMSDSVHVLTKYMNELREGNDPKNALKKALKSIRLATFLTAVTTAIGFLTLIFSNIKPISDFGLYTSVGVLLAYGLTFTLLPAMILVIKPTQMQVYAMREDFWTKKLHRFFAFVLRRRKWILIGAAISVGISFWGISLIKVDNLMLEDLRDNNPLKQDFNFMDEKFIGCRPFEMSVQLKSTSDINDLKTLEELNKLDTYLRDEYGVGALFSWCEMVKSANRTLNGGDDSYRRIPADSSEMKQIVRYARSKQAQSLVKLVYNAESKSLRVTGRLPDKGRKYYEQKNKALNAYITNHFTQFEATTLTGTAMLMDINNAYLVDNTILDLFLSILVIGLVMGVVYKSWRMVPMTIIPNLLPLIVIGGLMGFLGIPLKVSTSIVFNIAFGIAVDDTVHFLARVRTLGLEGYSRIYAVKRTFMTTGKAMIVTGLILTAGFSTLIFSEFLGTFYIGFLISLTLLVAILFELTITPLLLILLKRKEPMK